MNAFQLNTSFGNSFPVLRTDSLNTNANTYSSFLSPSLIPSSGVVGDNLSLALSSVPVGTSGSFASGNFAAPQSTDALKSLVAQGIITEDEYKNQIRRSYGLSSVGSNNNNSYYGNDESSDALGALSGKTLEKAKKSHSGDYKVTDAQAQMASQVIEQVKEVLKKDPSEVSEEEAEGIKKVFSDLSKNPMIAEAFVKEANETSFRGKNGKTSNLLASYEQVLTNLHGQKDAQDSITEIKKELYATIGQRNPESLKEFGKGYTADAANVDYSFTSRLKNKAAEHPFAALTVGTAGVAALGYGTYKAARLVGLKNMMKVGKFGALAAGATALAASVYSLAKD